MTIEYVTATGLTMTMYLFPFNSETVTNGSGYVLAEQTNRKGLYLATQDNGLVGWFTCHVYIGSDLFDLTHVYISNNTDIFRCENDPPFHLMTTSQIVGPGAIPAEVIVEDGNNQPISGVQVWVSTDSSGTNVIGGTITTNDFGIANFLLNTGTYYVWRRHPNYFFTNPKTLTV